MAVVLVHEERGDRVFLHEGEAVKVAELESAGYVHWPRVEEGQAPGAPLGAAAVPEPSSSEDGVATPLAATGLADHVVALLADHGYTTTDQVRAAPDADLRAIDGVGPATLREVRRATEG